MKICAMHAHFNQDFTLFQESQGVLERGRENSFQVCVRRIAHSDPNYLGRWAKAFNQIDEVAILGDHGIDRRGSSGLE